MIEVIRPHARLPLRLAVFDFDGTLSLVRCGWQQVMAGVIVDALGQAGDGTPPAELQRLAEDFVIRTTGQATIDQMHWLAEEVARRGGVPASPATYKQRFDDRLSERLERRLAELRAGERSADSLLVPGARALLDALQARGLLLALLSGTEQKPLAREAGELQIAHYFGGRIFGPGAHDPGFTKQAVIGRLLVEYQIAGAELLGIGDGAVETHATHQAGGLALGVALDEEHGLRLDPRKRDVLINAGADLIIPHYGELAPLLDTLFGADHRTPSAL